MNGYPYYQNFGYQPNFTQPQQNFTQQSTTQDERIWVQNETSAEAYLLAPNGFARLWDSSTNRFYEKRADATGRPLPMDIYEYKRISPNLSTLGDNASKLSREDIDAKFEAITQRLEALENAKKGAGKNVKQSVTDDTGV